MSKTALTDEEQKQGYAKLVALTDRAQKGDQTALPALRELLKDPTAVELLGGNLAEVAQRSLVNKMSGNNLLSRECLTRKLELLRTELGGLDPPPLERLLVERVVACWLHLHQLEVTYAQRNDLTVALGLYYQRCLCAAQKRYLAAVKALALVRRLALPVLVAQVNIAQKQQVKVSGPQASIRRPPHEPKEPTTEAQKQ